jgi:ATP/maltotriose-dependent transcriptional regulator MalT
LLSVVTGVVAYLVARRQRSGRINTSEATQLWQESTALRAELRSEVTALRAQLATMEAKYRECEERFDEAIRRLTNPDH